MTLLTLQEAALRVSPTGQISVRTLDREAAAGRLAIVRIRRRKYVRAAELDRYLAAQECRSDATAIAGKSVSASEVVSALSALFPRAHRKPTPSSSKRSSAGRKSTLRLVASSNG